jgi:histidine triad (HIT) family protein
MTGCVFCRIVAGRAPARILRQWEDAVALLTIDPYTAGHALVIPRLHVRDAAANPAVTAAVMARAAQLAAETMTSANILTSWGAAARQTVWHLHVHVVPRVPGDQVRLGLWPWPRWAQLVAPVPGCAPADLPDDPSALAV